MGEDSVSIILDKIQMVTQPDFPFLVMIYSVVMATSSITTNKQTYSPVTITTAYFISKGDNYATTLFFISCLLSLNIFTFNIFTVAFLNHYCLAVLVRLGRKIVNCH